jgi:hypothetical protein
MLKTKLVRLRQLNSQFVIHTVHMNGHMSVSGTQWPGNCQRATVRSAMPKDLASINCTCACIMYSVCACTELHMYVVDQHLASP